jgi:hypothetical protein
VEADLGGHFPADPAANPAGLGIPFDMVAAFERTLHGAPPRRFLVNQAKDVPLIAVITRATKNAELSATLPSTQQCWYPVCSFWHG